MILGIDEVGRGPWAGPLVVGAVVLPEPNTIEGLTDSKKLSAKKRQQLDILIREQALSWGLGWVHADELDTIGLSAALKLATIRAVEAVKVPYHEIIIDGTINFLKETNKGQYVTLLPKADLLIPSVSAASIIAKVARDTFMADQDNVYPEYSFGSHVGYGTAKHRSALDTHGVTPLHRRSFAPIAALIEESTVATEPAHKPPARTSKAIGDSAELAAADWLKNEGYTIVERNWRTKQCEVDIIAEKQQVRYFVEVKYRSSSQHGSGAESVTSKKRKQMHFAAELYNARTRYDGSALLGVISVAPDGKLELLEVS